MASFETSRLCNLAFAVEHYLLSEENNEIEANEEDLQSVTKSTREENK